MRALLRALGLSIWGAIAVGLSVIFIVLAFAVVRKYRAVESAADLERELGGETHQISPADSAGSVAIANSPPALGAAPVIIRPAADTRKLLMAAFINRRYQAAIGYGQELVDQLSAEPGDLSVVAQAYFEINDCANALSWKHRAREAFQAAGADLDASLQALGACCDTIAGKSAIVLDSSQRARIARLLNGTAAARQDTGDAFVRMGELYYGFGQYELAVAAIERGLDKGNIAHPEDAYVYLGRSEVAMGQMEAARDAFAKLKDVPGISPRVLQLWTLYAQTQLGSARLKMQSAGLECQAQ